MNYRGDDYVMGHLLRRAREVREGTLLVDLMSGQAAPASLLTREVAGSVAGYVTWFPKQLARQGTSLEWVRAARMTIAFDLTTERPSRYAPDCIESPYVCRVEIEDDRGKVWSSEIRDWWFPEPTARSGKQARRRRAGLVRTIVRLGQVIRSVWACQPEAWAAA
jgi:hypothetical protein